MSETQTPVDTTTPLAFVGLGAMGLPMTRQLAATGHRVTVYDLSDAAQAEADAIDGVLLAENGAAAAAAGRVLFTCLPNDAILREAYLGAGGLGQAVPEGAITIDCSTVSPAVTTQVHDSLAGRGVRHLDAAMLGSVPQAETGEIGFVVGGARSAFDDAGPLLDILGRFRSYAGPSGSGNRIKLIHQTLVATNAVAVAEAVALCLNSGTDLDCFYDVVCNGGGMAHSRYFEKRIPRMREGEFSPLFALDLMRKDVGLAQALAHASETPAPLLDRVVERMAAASEAGHGGEDFSAVARLYEQAIGRPFGPETAPEDQREHRAQG